MRIFKNIFIHLLDGRWIIKQQMQEISEIVIIHKMAANIYLCSDFYLNTELSQSAEIFFLRIVLIHSKIQWHQL